MASGWHTHHHRSTPAERESVIFAKLRIKVQSRPAIGLISLC